MRDFLLKDYEHLSRLWARRDEMRLAFLRFYFLFLAAIVTIIGFVTKDNALTFEKLIGFHIMQVFIFVAVMVGFLTFALINFIRMHNLKCTKDMQTIADILTEQTLCKSVKRHSLTPSSALRTCSGIDFANSLTVGILNTVLIAAFCYNYEGWVIIGVTLMSFAFHVIVWNRILSPKGLSNDRLTKNKSSRKCLLIATISVLFVTVAGYVWISSEFERFEEKFSSVKPGMTKSQIVDIAGEPTTVDTTLSGLEVWAFCPPRGRCAEWPHCHFHKDDSIMVEFWWESIHLTLPDDGVDERQGGS